MTAGSSDPRTVTPGGRRRARGLGIAPDGRPGRWNAITDVAGVEVGYATLVEGEGVRTGVTAIHPRGRAGAGDPCAAGVHSQNGNGEMTGLAWIGESGTCSGPICLTNTHAVGTVHAAVVRWTVEHHPRVADAWLLPVVSETWDGYLNDVNGAHVTEGLALQALAAAGSGPLEEGAVGGGTGMCCYEYKGGSGTASRLVEHAGETYTIGVLLQANFGARNELTIAGVPLGQALADDNPLAHAFAAPPGAGSVVAVIATDAPLLPHQCAALARRTTLGLARTGTSGSHFSGDLFLAVSTGNPGAFAPGFETFYGSHADGHGELRFVPWGAMDPFYEAVVQATEESVLNALAAGEDMVGHRGRVPGMPNERVAALVRQRSSQG